MYSCGAADITRVSNKHHGRSRTSVTRYDDGKLNVKMAKETLKEPGFGSPSQLTIQSCRKTPPRLPPFRTCRWTKKRERGQAEETEKKYKDASSRSEIGSGAKAASHLKSPKCAQTAIKFGILEVHLATRTGGAWNPNTIDRE
jgi:hypothetical protein